MKKTIVTLAALSMLAAIPSACSDDGNGIPVPQTVATISPAPCNYTIGTEHYTSSMPRQQLLAMLLDYADAGYIVSVYSSDRTQNTKAQETIIFTTHNRNEALEWAGDMVDRGYSVVITKNQDTGLYTCVATR